MSKVSAVVLTKNEEANIQECLKTLAWCDEVVVIDDFSEDKTVSIAEKSGAKVYRRKLDGDFAAQRNFGLSKAKEDWVLFVDADERVTPALASEIQKEIVDKDGSTMGFAIKRLDVFCGKTLRYGEWGSSRFVRLGRNNDESTGKWYRAVHEYWLQDPVDYLKNPLLHYPHQTIKEFISHVDKYSTLHAQENKKEGKRSTVLKLWLWPILKFIDNFFFRLGFLDGSQGMVYSYMMSFHSYLAWSKLLLLQKVSNK